MFHCVGQNFETAIAVLRGKTKKKDFDENSFLKTISKVMIFLSLWFCVDRQYRTI